MKAFLRRHFPLFYAKLIRMMAFIRRLRFNARDVNYVYGGFPLKVRLADGMAEAWYNSDWPDLPELALLRQHRLKAGARVFDLGGHQGVVGMILAKTVGKTGQVVVVEADQFCAKLAAQNRDANDFADKQMVVLRAAISDHSGRLDVPEKPRNQGSVHRYLDWGSQGVRAMTLDDLSLEYGLPDVVFMDVDGFECHALRGGRKTLAAKPDVFIEVHVGAGLEDEGASREELLNFFPESEWVLQVGVQDGHAFVPYEPGLEFLNARFYLVATAR